MANAHCLNSYLYPMLTGADLYEKLKDVRISGGACAFTPEKCESMAPLVNAINALKKERNAVILAHSYVSPEIDPLSRDLHRSQLGFLAPDETSMLLDVLTRIRAQLQNRAAGA